jgi:hypothetical protein
MPDKAEKLSLVNDSRRHYGMNEQVKVDSVWNTLIAKRDYEVGKL